MRLLAVSYAYPPLRYPRAIQVARLMAFLPDAEVTVVAAEEDGLVDRDDSLLRAYPDGDMHVVRVPWSTGARMRAFGRTERLDKHLVPDRFRPWHRDAVAAIRRRDLLVGADALVTFGQPMSDHLIGLALVERRAMPWIVHLSDPWSDNPFAQRRRLAAAWNRRLEARVLRRADAIVVTNTEARDLVAVRLGDDAERRVHVLPHTFDARLYPVGVAFRNGLRVRYIGSLYGGRSPQPLIRALELLRQRGAIGDVTVELVGPTTHAGNAAGVVLRPPVPYLESLGLMRESDLLLNLEAPNERSPFLPSKLVDYLGARVPIASLAPDGAGAALVRHAGGWHADPSDCEQAVAMLAEALACARARPRGASWGNDGFVGGYAAGVVAAQARSLIAEVVESARTRRA